MKSRSSVILGLMLSAVLLPPALAAPGGVLSGLDRSAIVQALAEKVKANYVFPDVADRIAVAILKKNAGGGYNDANNAVPSPGDMEGMRVQASRLGYGIEKIQRLPGNVGYIELWGFGPTEFVGPAYSAAMQLLAGTDALIIDLRRIGYSSPPALAQQTAYVAILRSLLASANDPEPRDSLQRALGMAEKGESETPVYTLRQ